MAWFSNPIAFTRGPVTIITTLIYIAIITLVIVTQTRVPPAPTVANPDPGVNLTEAWNDLQLLSAQYHPYNSRRNDFTRDWLVQRINSILEQNEVPRSSAYVFEDNLSNLTFSSAGSASSAAGISVYFEGTNIITYIRGSEDDQSEWWTDRKASPSARNGVLVNAHYDSVSTGYGATDDGVGVVTILQLISHYTTEGNAPASGLVLLLNNGEEDFLNGASVFSQHPMSKLVSSFLNLEGAGAGGRAALFRSTDEEVTKAYAKSPYPFGTVISADAFKRGLIRSQTDYVVFNERLGLRGLDVAFIAPRARYHTDEDDSRHTGQTAIWHMLSAALATTKELTNDSPRISTKALTTQKDITVLDDSTSVHPAIWFDIFGLAFAVMQAHTFFALCVTVLVVGPLLLILTMIALYRSDKFYMLSSSRSYHTMDGDEKLPLKGWRGVFRFPLVLLLSCAAPIALAYLMFKVNPFIAHSSEWAVWSMMVSSFVFVAWFFCRSLDSVRPSALTRAYGLSWLTGAWWVVLIAETVFEEHFHVYGGYFVLFYSAALFIATWLAYLELFSLPTKSKYCKQKLGVHYQPSRSTSMSRPPTATQSETGHDQQAEEGEDATESSSLLRNNRGRSAFKNYSRSAEVGPEEPQGDKSEAEVYNNEQEWSKPMWTWMWLLEFLILVPINVILLGQVAMLLVTALHQTGADGNSTFIVYLGMAILTILMFSPIVPLLHRFTYHIPLFLFLVLIGTVVYNLLAFPFSSHNRLKLFFQQEVDLQNGTNTVSLIGVPGYVQEAISYIPSASGQIIDCGNVEAWSDRMKCSWTGPAPKVASTNMQFAAEKAYSTLVSYNVTLTNNGSDHKTARFVIYGKNTRACKLVFNSTITDFHVTGQGPVDKRFEPVPREAGSKEIRLWSRTWNRAWTVDVTWDVEDKETRDLTGKVVCLWSDDNQNGVIPALDEVRHFVPEWVAVTKAGDGLVEGFKRFKI